MSDNGSVSDIAGSRFPTVIPVGLPPIGVALANIRVLSGTKTDDGSHWVRVLYFPAGQLAVIDLPADLGPDMKCPAEELGQMIIDAARQARSGLVTP